MSLAALAIAAAAGGQIYAAHAEAAEAASMQEIEKSRAAAARSRAAIIGKQAEFELKRHAEAGERIKGALEAEIGATGAVTTVGSPLLARAKQASELELQNLMIGYEAQVRTKEALSEAEEHRMIGKLYGKRAKAKKTSGYLRAGTTLLSGFDGLNIGGTTSTAYPASHYPTASQGERW